MLLDRRPDGSLVIETRWDDFVTAWRAADDAHRVALGDGRPAVMRDAPLSLDADPKPAYLTVAQPAWDVLRRRVKEAFRGEPPPPRTRLCQACRGPLTLAKEYEDVWTFVCGQCRSRETGGKDVVGGTRGAGEREAR